MDFVNGYIMYMYVCYSTIVLVCVHVHGDGTLQYTYDFTRCVGTQVFLSGLPIICIVIIVLTMFENIVCHFVWPFVSKNQVCFKC